MMLKALIKTIDFFKDLSHKRLFAKISITTLICICIAYLLVWIIYLTPQAIVAAQSWHHLIAEYVNSNEVNPTQLYNKALNGLQSSLVNRDISISQGMIDSMLELIEDKHTVYFSPEQYDRFMEGLSGTYKGIGIWINANDEGHIIISPIPDSPAAAEGILVGDRILEIDGLSTEGMSVDEAGILIRGEPNTQVTLKVLHADQSTETIAITRAEVVLPSVLAEEIEENIVYSKIYSFSGTSAEELIEGLNNLVDEDTIGIILDLRDNGGGLISDCVQIASQFIDEGNVVMHEVDGDSKVQYTWLAGESETMIDSEIRVAVLQNEGSASASEILAGVLQDLRDNTSVIGTLSYKKGSAQRIFELIDGSAIKVTYTYWTTPNGTLVNGIGITPDILIDDELAQLETAIQYIRNT